MTDKERILTSIVRELYATLLNFSGPAYAERLEDRVHFDHADPQPGDLVFATSGYDPEWLIGWYVEAIPGAWGGAVIREIGTDRTCNYTNVTFARVVGMHRSELLEGAEYEMQQKVLKAFAKGDEYLYRFGGCDFPAKGKVAIWIREAFGGMGKPSVPFSVEMKYTPRTSVKTILKVMREGGYGTRSFEPK